MASKARSSEGCWTCRLRRKKCDEIRPVCACCEALDIACLYSEIKPEWMDGAQKQKVRADELKAEVKRKAAWRREKRYLQAIEAGIGDLAMTSAPPALEEAQTDGEHVAATSSSTRTLDGSPDSGLDSDRQSSQRTLPHSLTGLTPPSSKDSNVLDGSLADSQRDSADDGRSLNQQPLALSEGYERELNFVMMYLDYVFPFLFPYYNPHVLQSGRGWLLVLLLRNKALFHAALSLASYFFAVVLDSTIQGHETCKVVNLDELQKQQELSLRELQSDLNEINCRGVAGFLLESVRVLESIIQMLCFDVASAQTGHWQMHLDAATELFGQIMQSHGQGADGFCWHGVLMQLSGMGIPPFLDLVGKHPWNSDQSALRFFASYLLYIDVVASTVLEQPPHLQRFHSILLMVRDSEASCAPPGQIGPHLQLDEFVGMQNWVIVLLGRISELQAWKKEMKKSGSLSMVHLVSRATQIEAELRSHVEAAEPQIISGFASTPSEPPHFAGLGPLDLVSQYHYHPFLSPRGLTWITRIWAQAALTYLSVVVSGWQPGSVEIRESVLTTIGLLSSLPSAACLRATIWPFCLTGCLAAPDQEHIFRDMVTNMGALAVFGTVKEALAIMEHVWSNRTQIEELGGEWDLAMTLTSLGRLSLLV
ncbi:Transcriptional regulatory protein pro1 [Pleurostoma richardsiae]|uniref:Transcriptional regulatory protein pro1 n=1 Tax=Pleurostoma richardsiae TaxID=41990 RepID=A0AA38VTE1_9PEZI|nr:Transcriptional regulatory protein pro1 [Pleurostoma richardsiae]